MGIFAPGVRLAAFLGYGWGTQGVAGKLFRARCLIAVFANDESAAFSAAIAGPSGGNPRPRQVRLRRPFGCARPNCGEWGAKNSSRRIWMIPSASLCVSGNFTPIGFGESMLFGTRTNFLIPGPMLGLREACVGVLERHVIIRGQAPPIDGRRAPF
jgi:hypothetical protein